MPRKPRELLDEGYYHLIARGNNRLFIFSIPGGFEVFKTLLLESKRKYPWKLSHYCLMVNHIHLLGQITKGKNLPKLMQYLLFEYSRWYRKQTGYTGHLWQGRYKSPLIEKESYFLECGRYIERNPVRAKIVKQAEDYSYSSYRYYAFGESNPLVDEDPYYEDLGHDPASRQKAYREFVRLEGPYDKLVDQSLLEIYF
ncbi:MAG: transposase [Candidatus Omnitrophica bacterium]|nr:transposase [Candidatus Omnitrophota bacterium]